MTRSILKQTALLIVVISIAAVGRGGPKWSGLNPTVEFFLDEEGCEDVIDEWPHLERGFRVWGDVPESVIRTRYLGQSSNVTKGKDNRNVIAWEKGLKWGLGKNVVSATYCWHTGCYSCGGTMLEFDIVLNGEHFEWSTTKEKRKLDVGCIVTREAAFGLGLGNNKENDTNNKKCVIDDTTGRNLDAEDSLYIAALYPRTAQNNRPPRIISTPVAEAVAGIRYRCRIEADDLDGDTLIFRLVAGPLNMRIDSCTGIIDWYPKFLDIGPHLVEVVCRDRFGVEAKTRYTLTVSNLVVYTEDTTVQMGDTLYHNVYVSPMDEYGVYAGNIELGFDKEKMVILNVDTVGSVIAGASFAKNIIDNMIKVAFANAEPFTGEGILFRIKMMLFDEACNENIILPIGKAFFNDGDPVATTRDGKIYMPCSCDGHTIDGKVVHANTREGVGNALMRLEEVGLEEVTSEDGFFAFRNVPYVDCGGYTLTAAKDSGDIRESVSAFDASLVLRNVVDLKVFNDYAGQPDAADVNANDMITAYDAALILRFILHYNDATKIGWWVMDPENQPVNGGRESVHNLEVLAYMIGDVSGNWKQKRELAKSTITTPVAGIVMTDFEEREITLDSGTLRGYATKIMIENPREDLYSGEITVDLDSSRFRLNTVKPLALLNGFMVKSNTVGNSVMAAFAGTEPVMGEGEVMEVEIVPVGDEVSKDDLDDITISFARLNEYKQAAVSIKRERYFASVKTAAAVNSLRSVYPNPFVNRLSVEYSVADEQRVNIFLCDLRGRKLATLVDGKVKTGMHKVVWQDDKVTRTLAPQVYLLRFVGKDYIKTSKIFKVR